MEQGPDFRGRLPHARVVVTPRRGLKSASKGEAPRWRRRSYPGPGLTPSPRRGCENLNAAPLRSNAAEVALLRANISRRRDMLYGSRRDMLELGRLITYPVETRRAVGMTTMGECARAIQNSEQPYTGGNSRQRTAGGSTRRGASRHATFVQKTGHYRGDLGN